MVFGRIGTWTVMIGVQVRAMMNSESRYLEQPAPCPAGIVFRRRNWNVAENQRPILNFTPRGEVVPQG
jgi:hypothetical protein